VVLVIAVGVSLMFGMARRKLTDYKRMKRVNKEIKEFNKALMAAKRSGDTHKVTKLQKKEKQMKSLQLKMMTENFKSMLFLAPFMIAYFFLNSHFEGQVLAISPIPIPLIIWTIGPELPFVHWYIVCSMAFSSMITKVLGVDMA